MGNSNSNSSSSHSHSLSQQQKPQRQQQQKHERTKPAIASAAAAEFATQSVDQTDAVVPNAAAANSTHKAAVAATATKRFSSLRQAKKNKAGAKNKAADIEQATAHIRPALKYSTSYAALNAASNESPLLKQSSTWSLGSLKGQHNLSFHESVANFDGNRSSFRNRNKSSRKSFNALQLRRCKTAWHKPLTNAIFNSHFKDNSRNEQFHIEHLIAKGAFGVVFKVIDSSQLNDNNYNQQYQKKPVAQPPVNLPTASSNSKSLKSYSPFYALKVLKKSKIIPDQGIKQIKDEVDIQKLCGHHPFVVQQIDLWQNRHNLHILSEYVPNGELFSRIAQFSLDLIRVYLAEIALAIDFLHNAGIIYRDAKPENILLTETYHLKLTDFGLSKWLKLGATTKTMCGTFQYMAPEILRGEAYGHAVDWWSLGIIACQMFTNEIPHIKQYLNIRLPESFLLKLKDVVDHQTQNESLKELLAGNNEPNAKPKLASYSDNESQDFLPAAVQQLPHAGQDVLRRLLVIDAKQRLRSVLALQKISLYQHFKIDSKHLLQISPLDIIKKDNIEILDNSRSDCSTTESLEDFLNF